MSAACAALLDGNVLVARTTLDIVSTLFPLHQPFLLPSDSTLLLAAALQTLLRRDLSLSRRLSAWVLSSQVESSQMTGTHLSAKPSSQPPTQEVMSSVPATPTDDLTSDYFQRFARTHLLSALREIIAQSLLAVRQSSKTDSILPYRLLRALLDKPEIGDRIAKDILLDVVVCLKNQVDALGPGVGGGVRETGAAGLSKGKHFHPLALARGPSKDTSGKKVVKRATLKAEIVQSANLFFGSLRPEQLWEWMSNLIGQCFSAQRNHGDTTPAHDGRDSGLR